MGENSSQSSSEFSNLYKKKSKSAENLLDERREKLQEEQKERRHQTIDQGREKLADSKTGGDDDQTVPTAEKSELTNVAEQAKSEQIHQDEVIKKEKEAGEQVDEPTLELEDAKKTEDVSKQDVSEQMEVTNIAIEGDGENTDVSTEQADNPSIPENKDETEEYEWQFVYERKQLEKKFLCLMDTQWFTNIPDDLEENWLIKCVPEGYRIMLYAEPKYATCFNFKGKPVLKVKTNFCTTGKCRTIFDCIYHRKTKTIFILDCLIWNTRNVMGVEARFRFSWLKNKFMEHKEFSSCNKFKFVLIDYMPAKKDLIQEAMFKTLEVNGNKYYYDGVAFYQKSSLYNMLNNPSVGWLASYMLTDIFQIEVSSEHLVKMPKEYKSAKEYIQDLQKKRAENRRLRNKRLKKKRLLNKKKGKKKRRKKKTSNVETDDSKKAKVEGDVSENTVSEMDVSQESIKKSPTEKTEKRKRRKRRNTKVEKDFPKRTKLETDDSENTEVENDEPKDSNVAVHVPKKTNVQKDASEDPKVEIDVPKNTNVEVDVPEKNKTEKVASEDPQGETDVPENTEVEEDVFENKDVFQFIV